MTTGMRNHAIVVGAGIGGIAFAEVLSRHFKKVTVLERDDLPNGPSERRFVPQGAHINGILVRGREALRQLFPEWESKALSAGAVLADFGTDLKWITRNGDIQKFPKGSLESICCSRVFLEWAIREELIQRNNVRIHTGVFVEGLSLTPDKGSIMGVKLKPGKHALARHLHADLVVESGGKGTHLPQWLEELALGLFRFRPSSRLAPILVADIELKNRRKSVQRCFGWSG